MPNERKIESLKEIQQIALEGLKLLKSVCEKNGLTYMISGGTLLGAVRHKGFIPWDDDIDTIMPRCDYEKLKHFDQSEFGKNWKLYSYDTEPGFYQTFMKLCYIKTEKRPSPFESGLKYGISVDIFPYDNLPAKNYEEALRKAEEMRKVKARYMKLTHPIVSKRRGILGDLMKPLLHIQHKIVTPFLSVSAAYKKIDSKRIIEDETSEFILVHDDLYKQTWRRDDVIAKNGVIPQLSFEGEMFNVPLDWDKMLKGSYGNYMELPPVEKRIAHGINAYYID